MEHNIDENKLLKDLEEFIRQRGYDGFFGLIAKLTPDKVDKKDIDDYRQVAVSTSPNNAQTETGQVSNLSNPTAESAPIKEASIYAARSIPAVQEDMMTHPIQTGMEVGSEPKVLTLEKPQNRTPNPWGDAEVKRPGELKL